MIITIVIIIIIIIDIIHIIIIIKGCLWLPPCPCIECRRPSSGQANASSECFLIRPGRSMPSAAAGGWPHLRPRCLVMIFGRVCVLGLIYAFRFDSVLKFSIRQ